MEQWNRPPELIAVQVDLLKRSEEDFCAWPDVAVTADDAQWPEDGGKLTVTVDNIGNCPARDVTGQLTAPTRKVLAGKNTEWIEAPLHLEARRIRLEFTRLENAPPQMRAVGP